MACEQSDRLLEHLYEELEGPEREHFEAHLETCAECKREQRGLRPVRAASRMFAQFEPSAAIDARILAALTPALAASTMAADSLVARATPKSNVMPSKPRRPRWLAPLGTFAAAALVLLVVNIASRPERASPGSAPSMARLKREVASEVASAPESKVMPLPRPKPRSPAPMVASAGNGKRDRAAADRAATDRKEFAAAPDDDLAPRYARADRSRARKRSARSAKRRSKRPTDPIAFRELEREAAGGRSAPSMPSPPPAPVPERIARGAAEEKPMPPAPSALRDEPAPAATNDGFIAGAPAPKAKKAGVAQQHSRAAAAPAERDRFAEIEQLRGKKAFGAARDATRSLLRKRLDRPERVRALLLLVDIELEWGHLAEARATLDRLDRLAPERSSEWAARRQRVHEPPPAATTSSPR